MSKNLKLKRKMGSFIWRKNFNKFLRKEIPQNSRVLAVSPGLVHNDPSTHFLDSLVKVKGGKLVLFGSDAPVIFKVAWKKYTGNESPVLVHGDAVGMKKKRYGTAVEAMMMTGKVAGVAGMKKEKEYALKDNSFGIIYDHSALRFIRGQEALLPWQTVGRVLRQYLRVVKPGGKIIITDDKQSSNAITILKKFLEEGRLGKVKAEIYGVKEGGQKIGPQKILAEHPAHRVFIITKSKEWSPKQVKIPDEKPFKRSGCLLKGQGMYRFI